MSPPEQAGPVETGRAVASCVIAMQPATAAKIATHAFAKGDVIGVARIAAIQAAKRTSELVPSVFSALLGAIDVQFVIGEDSVSVEAHVASRDTRSVEMEAMSACAVGALTIYDMCKAVDRSMTIDHLTLGPRAQADRDEKSRDKNQLK